MKYLIFLLIPLYGLSQTQSNFSLNDRDVIWKKTFTTSLSFAELQKQINISSLFDETKVTDSTISGRTTKVSIDYRGAGFKTMNTPMYLNGGNFLRTFAIITHQGDKYIVTLKDIVIIDGQDIHAGILSRRMGQETPLAFYIIKDKESKIRKHFYVDAENILEYNFNKRFAF